MTMNEKIATPAWVNDGPYKLIVTPYTYLDVKSHSAVAAASDMASIHNMFIRGLNAIVLQAPQIPTADQPGYVEQDVLDLLKYIQIWGEMLDHHHEIEETVLFPRWEELLNSPGLLTEAEEEHEAFIGGLNKLKDESMRFQKVPREYRWPQIKAIIDSFAEPLVLHLSHEIEMFLGFKRFDNDLLWKGWKEAEDYAKNSGGLAAFHDFIPFALTHNDKTYEGKNTFFVLPLPLQWAVNWYFSKTYKNIWRFAPCDTTSKPRALPFLPGSRVPVAY